MGPMGRLCAVCGFWDDVWSAGFTSARACYGDVSEPSM